MKFLTFVWKNATRRKLRSSLTVFAVAIAVGAVVSLVGIAVSFERSFLGLYEANGIDLIVVRAGVAQRLTSVLDEKLGGRIQSISGVKRAIPGLVDVVSFAEAGLDGVVIQGWVPEPLYFEHLHFLAGRPIQKQDGKTIILGAILAANLGKKLHDTLEVFENQTFEVVGVYESYNVFENGCMIMSLAQLQRLTDRSHQVTGFSVMLEPEPGGKPLDRVRHDIESLAPSLKAMPVREHVETLTELRVCHAMAWLTSAVALLIGTAGVLNTMVMSIHERTREIGILRAVGWGQWRVVRAVLSESLMLSLVGALLGTLGATVLVHLLTRLPAANGLIDGHVPLDVIGQGFLIAVLVGLLGGSVSAYRAARMLPVAALRHD
jgi:putative ABC transport system permease protein